MHIYNVGETYNPAARHTWPAAGAQWRLSEDGVELNLFLADPTAQEIKAVQTGRARFALTAGDHALILAHQFSPMPWSDSPWQACRQNDVTTGIAAVPPGQHLAVTVIIVDSTTGLIAAVRLTSWIAEFATAVSDAIRRQNRNRSTDREGAAEIDAWYRRYPTTKELVRAADITSPRY